MASHLCSSCTKPDQKSTHGTSFTESQIVNIKQQFSAMDADQDGLITEHEFLLSLKNANRDPAEYDSKLFFAEADKNKDGKISFPEFLEACERLGLGGQKAGTAGLQGKKDQREIDAIFREFDLDGNGFITAEELGKVLERQGEKLTEEELKGMIKAADLNGDNVIDKEEFAKMV
ncbi:calmodulin-like 3 [Podila horticola]|nr:calmodulin-like 3 [Podila horticola]